MPRLGTIDFAGDEPLDLVVREALRELGGPLGEFVEATLRDGPNTAMYADFQRPIANGKRGAFDPDYLLDTILDDKTPEHPRIAHEFTNHFEECLGTEQAARSLSGVVHASRHAMAHFQDSSRAEVCETLDTISAILGSLGDKDAAARVDAVAQPLHEEERRRSRARRRDRPKRNAVDGVRCVGIHLADPRGVMPDGWWVVSLCNGVLEALHRDQTDDEVATHLERWSRQGPLRAGLAFCFSAPRWYVDEHHEGDPRALWTQLSDLGFTTDRDLERVVAQLGHPFFSPPLGEEPFETRPERAFRKTERNMINEVAAQPSSVFEIGSPGSVGALAIRGMSLLAHVAASETVAVWPLDDPLLDGTTFVEIFPRGLWFSLDPSGQTASSPATRAAFLDRKGVRVLLGDKRGSREMLVSEKRAFDAFVTAWALSEYGRSLPSRSNDATARVEGEIWLPMENPPRS
jgi:hypothetical protein